MTSITCRTSGRPRRRSWCCSQSSSAADYELLEPIPDPTKEQAFFPRKNVLYTVNGKLKPKVTMYPGEVQRWRLLNAAEGKYMSLKLTGHDLHQVAWDGLTLHEPEATDVVLLSSGNRVELLIKAGKPGTYELVLTPGSSQKPNIPGMPESIPEHESELFCTLMGAMDSMAAAGLADEPPELQPRSILTLARASFSDRPSSTGRAEGRCGSMLVTHPRRYRPVWNDDTLCGCDGQRRLMGSEPTEAGTRGAELGTPPWPGRARHGRTVDSRSPMGADRKASDRSDRRSGIRLLPRP